MEITYGLTEQIQAMGIENFTGLMGLAGLVCGGLFWKAILDAFLN